MNSREEEGKCLRFGVDCCAMAYVDGERSDLGGSMGQLLDWSEAETLYSVGATLQVRSSSSITILVEQSYLYGWIRAANEWFCKATHRLVRLCMMVRKPQEVPALEQLFVVLAFIV